MARTFGTANCLTQESARAALRAASAGKSITAIAAAAGVSVRTLRRWISEGRKRPNSVYGAFLRGYENARAGFTTSLAG